MTSPRANLLQAWLDGRLMPEVPRFVYHRGELARDKRDDPALAELAEHLLRLSNGRFGVVSACGHLRGEIVGDGTLRLLTQRDRGETAYIAEKRG